MVLPPARFGPGTQSKENVMETIEALKSVLHHEHNEERHPVSQGFGYPLALGIVSYAGVMTLAMGAAALLTTFM